MSTEFIARDDGSAIELGIEEDTDHGLETRDLKRDLATLSSVTARLEAFIAS